MTRLCSAALLALFGLAVGAAPAAAQDFRGGIRGTVVDSTGGVLPGVTVTVTNTETGVAQTVVTDDKGLYRSPVSERRHLHRHGGALRLQEGRPHRQRGARRRRAPRRSSLATGGVEETVQVTAERRSSTPRPAISGTTVDAKQIAQLPLGDGTAYMLTRLAPGIIDSSDLHFARPADNGNLAGIVANGVQGGNEFTHRRRAEHVERARRRVLAAVGRDRRSSRCRPTRSTRRPGHTAGAIVNLALKSGTNAFHGAGGYFNRDDSRSATPLLTERAGGTKPTREYNRYTGTVSGPIIKNKTFFMASFEHLRDVQPEPADLHRADREDARAATSASSRRRCSIRSRRPAPARAPRSPATSSPSSRINPVAAAYAALYPLPNRPGTVEQLLHQSAAPLRLQRVHGTRRSQPQLGQPAVRARPTGTSAARIATTGRRTRPTRPTAAPSTGSRSRRGSTTAATSASPAATPRRSRRACCSTSRASWARFGESRDPAQDVRSGEARLRRRRRSR